MSMFKKQKRKKIPDGKYRIIKIGKEALFEFVYESVIDNLERYFDVTDGTKLVVSSDINWETGEFICVARNEYDENEHLRFDIDIESLLLKMQNTTGSMYLPKRYIELSDEEIEKL